MARAEDVQALEALTPWERPEFRADLASLSASTAEAARSFAADVRVLARLAAQVPRCAGDESGASPWTSFRQEVAVARSVSGQAAASELRVAMRLASVLPRTLGLLEAGRMTMARARAFVGELEVYDDEVARQLDAELAEVVARLAVWRIREEVRRAGLVREPEAAAVRSAAATAGRGVVLEPLRDDQAAVVLTGPAVPLVRWFDTLDGRARALRAAGDPRTLGALRFDLACATFPCLTHPPVDHAAADGALDGPEQTPSAGRAGTPLSDAAAGLRLSGVEAASVDCRQGRPVQAVVVVPVETALGLSNEPGWLQGYGWVSAAASRVLLVDAELRRLCVDAGSGQAVDLAPRGVRPPPTPVGVRQALVDMVSGESVLSDTAWQVEPEHDPSARLRAFTVLRDRTCDGPTQPRTPADRCDLDHDRPYPQGPTAAWNLVARSRRTHQLKHYGWTPVRTAGSTWWTSPAGQVVEVPHATRRPPGVDGGCDAARLPDPDQLAAVDAEQLTSVPAGSERPWLPAKERQAQQADQPVWTVLAGSTDLPPF